MLKLLYINLIIVFISQAGCAAKQDLIEKAFKNYKGKYVIFVSKKEFVLEVYDRKINKVISYKISYGLNPDKKIKLYAGDNRTPEGTYYINEILSMDADKKSSAYKKLKAMNKIFFKAKDGHSKFSKPHVDLGDNAYGPRFFSINYPNDMDKKRYLDYVKKGKIKPLRGKTPGIGSGIAIHGNSDEISIGHLSSNGCIRMYNNDIVELERYIQIGTPVIIVPY